MGHSGVAWDTPGRRGTLRGGMGHSGAPWDTLGRRGTLRGGVGHSRTAWDTPGRRGHSGVERDVVSRRMSPAARSNPRPSIYRATRRTRGGGGGGEGEAKGRGGWLSERGMKTPEPSQEFAGSAV